MTRIKKKPPGKRIVWRMSDNSPAGEYVSAARADAPTVPDVGALAAAPDARSSWKLSSIELLDGLQVTEQPLDSLPGELLDELFKR